MIDPDVRALLDRGPARVLVELRVGEASPGSIARAQDTFLSRLAPAHATVIRRYASIPLMALEIDATALRSLEAMTDLVVAVKPDRPRRLQ